MKRWLISNGERRLIKSGIAPFYQEAYNEAVASVLMDAMGVDHVGYDIVEHCGHPCSVCKDFITVDEDLITASQVIRSIRYDTSIPLYDQYVGACASHGLDIVPSLDRMIVVDYIIGNHDRHLNNFGIVRDSRTLEWLRPAPIYDSGSSMGHDLTTDGMGDGFGISCMPFADTYKDQLSLVRDLSWFDPDVVIDTFPKVRDILIASDGRIDADRVEAILGELEFRVSCVEDLK